MMLDSRNLLAHLIAFDTTSRNSNLPLVDFVRSWLDDCGVSSQLVADPRAAKANLLATVGPADRPGVVLSGHTDVVPVDGQAWRSDPFAARVADGRMHGRGACDMKGFIACALAAVPRMTQTPLRRPIHLAFSYDEEVGCKGVPHLLARLPELLPVPPFGCIVGEPTRLRLVHGHKGKSACRCTVDGRAGHSALTDEAVNAVAYAGELVAFVHRLGRELRQGGPHADGFTPSHSTASLGRIEGGGQINIVPDRCSFEFEFRTIPGHDPRGLVDRVRRFAETELLPEMRAVAPEAAIAIDEFLAYPALAPAGGTFGEWCRELSGDDRPTCVSYGTEAGLFAAAGVPTMICGPGDMSVAHRPDEYVELAQLAACDLLLDRLIERCRRA